TPPPHPPDRRSLRPDTHPLLVEARLVLVVIGLVADRVPAGIFVEIDVAVRLHPLPDCLRGAMVTLLGGADEVIVRAVHAFDHGLKTRHGAIDQLARRDLLLR